MSDKLSGITTFEVADKSGNIRRVEVKDIAYRDLPWLLDNANNDPEIVGKVTGMKAEEVDKLSDEAIVEISEWVLERNHPHIVAWTERVSARTTRLKPVVEGAVSALRNR